MTNQIRYPRKSEAQRRCWADPEERAKRLAGQRRARERVKRALALLEAQEREGAKAAS